MADLGSRRVAARRDRVRAREAFLGSRAGDVDQRALDDAVGTALAAEPDARERRVFPTGDVRRWVPIGPSVVRRGQGSGRPRVTGRIRDLAVHPAGRRAYAASARGGVWYTGDGGASWAPVGGWAERQVGTGGPNNAQSCGSLLVTFGNDPGEDLVLVGTGETVPFSDAVTGQWGGVGVLVGKGAAARPVGDNPWEAESGLALLQGLGVFRLVRDPASVAESTSGATTDRVLAATSGGLFLGTRQAGPPASYSWAKLPGIDTLMAQPPTFTHPAPPAAPAGTPAVTDVLWVASSGAQGRILVSVAQRGLAYSDDGGTTFTWLGGLAWPATGETVQGYSTLALAPGTTTVYALTGLRRTPGLPSDVDDDTALFRVPDLVPGGGAAPAATRVRGVPVRLWPGQRDYDQALDVDVVTVGADPAVHRVYLGGSYFEAVSGTYDASLWCFDVDAGGHLVPSPGVSRRGNPGTGATAGDGAVVAGHIGQGVHADVHVVRLVNGGSPATRRLWVGCDGGVYVSSAAGRALTFAPRCTGLATLEAGFSASHPSASHLVAAGLQDNGTQVRVGDTVWEEVFQGDGGGIVVDPAQPHRLVGQYIRASWSADPGAGFVSPTSRIPGGGATTDDRENGRAVSAFYSGGAAVQTAAGTTRLAVGTNRVWLSDDLGTATPNTWRVLRFPGGAPLDARPGGTDPADRRRFGVPSGALGIPAMTAGAATGPLGSVVTLRWADPTTLLVMFQYGVVRWTETAPGTWQAAFLVDWAALPGNIVLTDVAPVPGGQDLYLTTTGDAATPGADTCYLYDATAGTTTATGLRTALAPLDPAYAVVVDPASAADVYVGTVTGVWHGVRTSGTTTVTWDPAPFVNGLPQAAVQDLAVHHDPASPGVRLLRAAVQSRGVWEVDLAAAAEPVRTYLRLHAYDDRRRFPTALADARRPAAAPPLGPAASPDITVRPESAAQVTPQWQLGTGTMSAGNAPTYQVWTFQTAFRWIFPSVLATGAWTPSFEGLVRQHRSDLGLPAGGFVDRALWDAVVGTRVDPATGAVSSNVADPLAVYRAPWQSAEALDAPATEIDLLECVQPVSAVGGVWQVHRERCTVEVLLHHRDTRPLAAGQGHAVLLWRSAPAQGTLLGLGVADLTPFLAQCAATGTVQPAPAGWQVAGPAAGADVASLGVPLDARVPRALSFDVDLSAVNPSDLVLLLAVAWSDQDRLGAAPVGMPVAPATPTVVDLARGWPYAALRLVQVVPRPLPGP